jgi:lysozyme
MNDNLVTNAAGRHLIETFEGLRTDAYIDTHDPKTGDPIWACGYGHSSNAGAPLVKPGDKWSPDYADEVLTNDLKKYEDKVRWYVKVPLTSNQFSALVSAAYNLSTEHFVKLITDSKLNDEIYTGVAAALMQFNISRGGVLRGLTARRKAEGALFDTPDGKEGLLSLAVSISAAAQRALGRIR